MPPRLSIARSAETFLNKLVNYYTKMKIKKLSLEDTTPLNDFGLPQAAVGNFPMQCPVLPHPQGLKILIVGDIPYDSVSKQPFSNASYGKLKILCDSAGVDIRHCYLHNVIDYYPGEQGFTSEAAKARLPSLLSEIDAINPDVIIPLGANVYRALFGDLDIEAKKQESSIEDERGFPRYFSCKHKRYLAVPTFHPVELFARHHLSPVASSDIKKAVRLGKDGWKVPEYKIKYWPTFEETVAILDYFYENKTRLSLDIETRNYFITCVGMAWSKTEAFVIPFHREFLKPYFTKEQELIVWRKLARVMETCPLLGQNAVHYDYKVLLAHNIRANFVEDSMFASWQCYQELPKTLAFMLSLYTDLPYHKDVLSKARRGVIDYKQEFYYCGLDCCSTLQVYDEGLMPELRTRPEGSYDRYRFNISLSRVFEYAGGHGVPFDSAKRDARVAELSDKAHAMAEDLNRKLGRSFNVRSPQQVRKLLYDEWKLPPKIKVTRDKDTGEEKESETADYLTILYLARTYPDLPQLKNIGVLRKLQKRISSLCSIVPKDGLVYWDFSTVGTSTGRAAGKKPLNGHGCQPQNVDRRDRDLFFAPKGYSFLKADLEGADSWTQAAQLACLGDNRLMRDLLAGLKPAQALGLARVYGDEMLTKDTADLLPLKEVLKTPDGEVIYRICKAVSHGSAYMMKEMTMHMNIFKTSDGDLFVNPAECKKSQQLFYKRYNFPKVHEFVRQTMHSKGYLDYSDGSRQYFLGRKDDATLREMLAAAPQCHTGRGANTTLLNVFHDPENTYNGRLLLQPINQVHDETDMLFPTDQLEKAREIFYRACQLKQTFWGQTFQIPFESKWGETWDDCDNAF